MANLILMNDEWTVYEDRLVHSTGYSRDFDYNNADSSHSDWVIEVGQKAWFKPEEFAEAFVALINHHGTRIDASLLLSFYRLAGAHSQENVLNQPQIDLSYNPDYGMEATEHYPETKVGAGWRL
ncbi:hypothetical protein ASG19_12775 [Rhizobium sp. Leaf306]|uniref:hypothetical protein n=1 Tax=Rhizobium sp. Leaf306 TaxID=1736330 RepID=UPI000712CE94|nr:hypothetical protein [Rhizobium sp. Leaf306]KQQ37206.1 hypothetical protein ASG19_12775 [Rhizobium sp. Leaf306]